MAIIKIKERLLYGQIENIKKKSLKGISSFFFVLLQSQILLSRTPYNLLKSMKYLNLDFVV